MKNILQEPPVGRTTEAEAASAHARINVPLNLENWRHLDAEVSDRLIWFHQHLLDEGMGWESAGQALGYEDAAEAQRVIFAALKGTLPIYDDIVERIEGYRKIVRERNGIIRTEFVETPISQLIWAGLDYAVANNSITLIEGDSGHGKTITTDVWAKMDRNNHGKTVRVEANAVGGTRVFLGEICKAVGANKNLGIGQMRDAIFRAFNPHRMLIVDEAARLLPKDTRTTPEKVEFLRELHDRRGCALALIATSRLEDELNKSGYLFEQVLGRIGMPIRLPRVLGEPHIRPIVVQYFTRPSAKVLTACEQLANNKMPRQQGRLRLLSQVLRLASRIASKKKTRLAEVHFFEAMAMREQMMGEVFRKET
ncbi:AAA family ATPase [Horticoccus sp. 23ND18S-11]|uniref:AAA family ATPase n=1 Tax=Horticoccus sp. 23ND18S-11 TaxID=3391832 RepID=UPI0039C9EF49